MLPAWMEPSCWMDTVIQCSGSVLMEDCDEELESSQISEIGYFYVNIYV